MVGWEHTIRVQEYVVGWEGTFGVQKYVVGPVPNQVAKMRIRLIPMISNSVIDFEFS